MISFKDMSDVYYLMDNELIVFQWHVSLSVVVVWVVSALLIQQFLS
jgi:hypothetical protein